LFFIISYSFVYNEVLGTCVWNNIAFTLLQVLAKKVAVLFSLAQRQLSKQDHYGFGLRELKAALLKAGELKRSSPDLPENVALTMAVRYLCPPKGN
jgi:dynein heavy chain